MSAPPRTKAVRVEIVGFVDDGSDGYPPIVECRLVDASGRTRRFIDKEPVVSREILGPTSTFPQPGVIACEVLETRLDGRGREIAVISTDFPWHVDSVEGQTRFEVGVDQLTEV